MTTTPISRLSCLFVLTLSTGLALAQSQLFVLNEGRFDWTNGVIAEAPSLGVLDLATSSYLQIASFDSIAFATDLEVHGEHGYVCLENTVMKVNLMTGEILHEVALEGAQELAMLEDMVYVTRGGLDPLTWGPLDLESHLVWLNADDLSFEGEVTLESGPQFACQAICIHNGLVVVGVNNGWVWGGEVGLVGTYDPASGVYTEVDLGEKVWHKFHAGGSSSHAKDSTLSEAQKIRAALLVDVVLSVEIVLLALASVADELIEVQVPVVVLLALRATVGGYGLVAGIVRMDDVGLALMKRPQRLWQALGRGMVATLPWLIKAIGLLGTVALLLVAGDMIIHHVHMVHHWVETWPGPLAATVVALVVGGMEVAVVELVRRLK